MAKKRAKKTKRHPVKRLEELLIYWEDYLSFFNYMLRAVNALHGRQKDGLYIDGAIKYYPEFRDYLLRCASYDPACNFWQESFLARFLGPPGKESAFEKYLGELASYPIELAQWNRSSRRTFKLSRDLQMLLEHTTLDGLTWKDVRWPLDAFVIELEEPIAHPQGWRYDTLLVSETLRRLHGDKGCQCEECKNQKERWTIRLIGDDLRSFTPRPLSEKRRLERLLQARNRSSVIQAIDRKSEYYGRFGKASPKYNLLTARAADAPVDLRFISEPKGENSGNRSPSAEYDTELGRHVIRHPYMEKAVHIIVGLCQYLQMLPPDSPHRSIWKPVHRGSLNPNSVTLPTEVCHVTSIHTLTPEERQILGAHREGPKGYELCAHFRIGHWRRPMGKGNDPTAPKTIWVRPTLVRRDRLGPGELPGGSQTDAL